MEADLDRVSNLLSQATLVSLGEFLGPCRAEEEKIEADRRAQFLFEAIGLLPNSTYYVQCGYIFGDGTTCGSKMERHKDTTLSSGYRFVCRGKPNQHPTTRINPKKNTLFEHKRLRYFQVLKLLVCFFEDVPLKKAKVIAEVSNDAIVWWYRCFRQTLHSIAWHDFKPLGGHTYVVEVDESFLFKAKYNRGRSLSTTKKSFWTFGGRCRITKKIFCKVVLKRDRPTLDKIMRECIQPQTHLCSDGWKAYEGCDSLLPLGCALASHNVVIHQTNFVYPPRTEPPLWKDENEWHIEARDKQHLGPYEPGCIPFRHHTQNAERAWREMKTQIRHGGPLTQEKLEEYIGAVMYRNNILKPLPDAAHKFATFLVDIGRRYPGPGKTGIAERVECDCGQC